MSLPNWCEIPFLKKRTLHFIHYWVILTECWSWLTANVYGIFCSILCFASLAAGHILVSVSLTIPFTPQWPPYWNVRRGLFSPSKFDRVVSSNFPPYRNTWKWFGDGRTYPWSVVGFKKVSAALLLWSSLARCLYPGSLFTFTWVMYRTVHEKFTVDLLELRPMPWMGEVKLLELKTTVPSRL